LEHGLQNWKKPPQGGFHRRSGSEVQRVETRGTRDSTSKPEMVRPMTPTTGSIGESTRIFAFKRCRCGAVVPGSIAAFALIHLDEMPGIHVEHLSHQLERSATEAALPGRVSRGAVNPLCDLFCPEQFHAQSPSF